MPTLLFASSAADASRLAEAAASAQAERLGVYVLAAIVGLLTAGLIACAREIRADLLERS